MTVPVKTEGEKKKVKYGTRVRNKKRFWLSGLKKNGSVLGRKRYL